MKKYNDLLTANAEVDYSLLDDAFWFSITEMLRTNAIKGQSEANSIRPTFVDMHTPFDL